MSSNGKGKKNEATRKKNNKRPAAKKPFTHIDRSSGVLLRESDLNKEKPWISPVSNQASVEKLLHGEYDAANN